MSDLYEATHVSAAAFTATPVGFEILEQDAALLEAAARFSSSQPERRPEDAVNPRLVTGWEHVYTGAITETYALGSTAVEASTFTTGRVRWQQDYPTTPIFRMPRWDLLHGTRQKVDHSAADGGAQAIIDQLPKRIQRRSPRVDMVHQSTLLRALGDLIGTDETEELFVPEQLFAFATHQGDSMAASRHTSGWMTLSQWLTLHSRAKNNALGIDFNPGQVIKESADRVRAAVGNSALRHGLGGLLDGDGRYYGDTMIVPEDISSPRDSRLGVVRLPSLHHHRAYGRALRAAVSNLADQTTYTSPPLLEPSPQI